jgi:3D (Asp-Asp-Asp) domain-containing protein
MSTDISTRSGSLLSLCFSREKTLAMTINSKLLQINRLAVSVACALTLPIFGARPPSTDGTYKATAYSVTGITASGEWTHRHVVAADPQVIPLGSRIKVKHAGGYSGEYVVADTGAKIIGRKLDIYMPSTRECMKFGARHVKVRVIQLGDGTKAATKQADRIVKQDVDKDIAKGAVGNAATDADWKAKGAETVRALQARASPPQE